MKNGDTAIKIHLEAGDDAKWHLLFPANVTRYRSDFPDGKIEFTSETLSEMVSNYAAEGKPERAVNYFHAGPSYKGGKPDEKIAAGWISDLRLTEAGLEALITWTKRAKEYILADELRYLSPEFVLSSTSRLTGKPQGAQLLGAALLNDPFLTELPRVAASETTENEMEEEIKALSEAKVAAESAKIAAEAKAETAAVALAETQALVTQLQAQVAEFEKERAEVARQNAERDAKAYVEGLVKAGKVAPAIREGVEKLALAHGIDAVKFLESSPAVVPQGEIGIVGEVTAKDKREEAIKRFNSKRDELQKSGLSFMEAHAQARNELPAEFELAFSAVNN